MRDNQTARAAWPLPHATKRKTAPAHLFVSKMLTEQISLFNLSPPMGPQVLEVVFCLLLAELLRPARSEVFMCQRALFSREAELNINSPRHTMLQEVDHLCTIKEIICRLEVQNRKLCTK